MAISVTNIGTNSNTSGATVALTSVTVPAGAAVVVLTMEQNGSATPGTTGSVADGTNGSYSAGPTTGADNVRLSLFYFLNTASLSAATITFTKAGSGNRASISAFYATGIATSVALDSAVTVTQNTVTGNPPVYNLTSGTPSVAGELFVAGVGTRIAASVPTFTQDTANGWAAPPNYVTDSGFQWEAGGTQVNSSTGTKTFNPTSTSPGGTVTALMLIAGFKPAPVTVSIVGVSGSGSVGSIAPSVGTTATGVAATGVVGTLTVTSTAIAFPVTGVSATGQIGSVVPQGAKTIAGVAGTGIVGALTPSPAFTVAGVAASGQAGSVVPGIFPPPLGVSGIGSAGAPFASQAVTISGVSATGSANDVFPIPPAPTSRPPLLIPAENGLPASLWLGTTNGN